ncbi:hypothetical protein AXG93_2164s1000 [Marchantia polymorpha subsp. ruderalis]|uniref:Glucan endo-1,3-beta-D-glucosidase n=1 Tax=Marchantia polymorpha subsp. ruderalis TaxID=1480154 RepID=A0A176VHG8_MARPO|nr:hypothetical protein AXG93_2164s1000 [Marchantia polymorpha subsp. ruderalis]
MASRHGSSLPSKCLSLKFILCICALTLRIGSTDAWTGICFGEDGSNIPSRTQVVQKFRDLGITHVRLYHTYQGTLQAFSNSGIQLTVGITNADFVSALSSVGSARTWVNSNIVPYGSSNIVAVTVGNEVFTSTADNVKNALLPSMKNLREALNQAGPQICFPPKGRKPIWNGRAGNVPYFCLGTSMLQTSEVSAVKERGNVERQERGPDAENEVIESPSLK